MITNFEEITRELSTEEKGMLRELIAGFETHNASNPIKEPDIIKGLQATRGIKLSGARLRKLVNFIRSNGMLPLIATSKGYYVSTDKQEVMKQIKSLHERSEAILVAAKGLEKFLL